MLKVGDKERGFKGESRSKVADLHSNLLRKGSFRIGAGCKAGFREVMKEGERKVGLKGKRQRMCLQLA